MASVREQAALETRAGRLLEAAGFEGGAVGGGRGGTRGPGLGRAGHARFAASGLGPLSEGFVCLDASRAWVAFWCLHSLNLLGTELPDAELGPGAEGEGPSPSTACADGGPTVLEEEATASPAGREAIGEFLLSCQAEGGGFGGGPGQLAHLGTTYAATAALASLGGGWLARSDREAHLHFMQKMQVVGPKGSLLRGGFFVHVGGETDTRGCYCAAAAAALLGLELGALAVEAMVDFLASCQSYEGGLGGEPGNEAHGGYTYCGVAALALVGRLQALNLPRLLRWAVARQGTVEGGFNGRTNKLADGCYSFWQGGLLCILQEFSAELFAQMPLVKPLSPGRGRAEGSEGEARDGAEPSPPDAGGALFDAAALQAWLLVCCQHKSGGLRDKPGKRPDFYHTCYCLSGLALAQRCGAPVLGPPNARVRATDALLNVRRDKLLEARGALAPLPCLSPPHHYT